MASEVDNVAQQEIEIRDTILVLMSCELKITATSRMYLF